MSLARHVSRGTPEVLLLRVRTGLAMIPVAMVGAALLGALGMLAGFASAEPEPGSLLVTLAGLLPLVATVVAGARILIARGRGAALERGHVVLLAVLGLPALGLAIAHVAGSRGSGISVAGVAAAVSLVALGLAPPAPDDRA